MFFSLLGLGAAFGPPRAAGRAGREVAGGAPADLRVASNSFRSANVLGNVVICTRQYVSLRVHVFGLSLCSQVTVAKSSSAESKVSMGYPGWQQRVRHRSTAMTGLETEYVVHECSMKANSERCERCKRRISKRGQTLVKLVNLHSHLREVRALALQRAEAIGLPEGLKRILLRIFGMECTPGKAYSIDVPVAPLVSVRVLSRLSRLSLLRPSRDSGFSGSDQVARRYFWPALALELPLASRVWHEPDSLEVLLNIRLENNGDHTKTEAWAWHGHSWHMPGSQFHCDTSISNSRTCGSVSRPTKTGHLRRLRLSH